MYEPTSVLLALFALFALVCLLLIAREIRFAREVRIRTRVLAGLALATSPVGEGPGVDGGRCLDLTEAPRGFHRCILDAGHEHTPGQEIHHIELP